MTDVRRATLSAQRVVVYGDNWPVVSAVHSMVQYILPDCDCSQASGPAALIRQLDRDPRAVLLLCLRPREHVFLFHALKNALIYHPALVISDELLFSDRVLLDSWGQLPGMTHTSLKRMITGRMLCEHTSPWRMCCPEESVLTDFLMEPMLPAGRPELPYSFHVQESLMDYMSLMMYRALTEKGLTPFRLRLLQAVWSGHHSLKELSGVMGVNSQKIWQEKSRLLTQLEMPLRLRELVCGTRFCLFMQRTPFIPVAETKPSSGMLLPGTPEKGRGSADCSFGRGSYSVSVGQ